MRTYIAIKFHKDCRNRDLIEKISVALKLAGIDSISMIRDYEKWCTVQFSPKELMEITFKEIDNSDFLLIEFSEKGVGLPKSR